MCGPGEGTSRVLARQPRRVPDGLTGAKTHFERSPSGTFAAEDNSRAQAKDVTNTFVFSENLDGNEIISAARMPCDAKERESDSQNFQLLN